MFLMRNRVLQVTGAGSDGFSSACFCRHSIMKTCWFLVSSIINILVLWSPVTHLSLSSDVPSPSMSSDPVEVAALEGPGSRRSCPRSPRSQRTWETCPSTRCRATSTSSSKSSTSAVCDWSETKRQISSKVRGIYCSTSAVQTETEVFSEIWTGLRHTEPFLPEYTWNPDLRNSHHGAPCFHGDCGPCLHCDGGP